MPIGYGKSFYNPRLNWMYRTEPEPQPRRPHHLCGRAGKVVGGSSSINAMVYSRAARPRISTAGRRKAIPAGAGPTCCPITGAWKTTRSAPAPGTAPAGLLHVGDIAGNVHPLTHAFVEAGKQAGLAFNPDLNGATTEGVGYYQINTAGGFRMSAARAYLWPALRTRRVDLVTDALVTKVRFEGRRAVGVAYRRDGVEHQARARGEVILAGGAVNTPQLLQLSGIGPGALLSGHGVAVAVADSRWAETCKIISATTTSIAPAGRA